MDSRRSLSQFASVAGLAAGAALLEARAALAAQQNLLVFLHVARKQRAFQNELTQALPGIAVTAVGRIADFDRALAEGQDAVLSLPLILSARGLAPKLRGQRLGSSEEKYALIAADALPDAAHINAVGALDLLGRDGTTDFVQHLVGSKPKVERVTKVEDLLPLLQMRRVDAILLPSRLFAELRTSSRMSLVQRELPGAIGLPAVASTGPGGAEIAARISKLPASLAAILGVDAWR
jgi:hypothetical protein